MKHFVFPFVIIAWFFSGIDAFGQDRFEAPAFIDGDFWQFRVVEHSEYMKTEKALNGTYEVTYSNGQFKVFKLDLDKKTDIRTGTGILIGLIDQTTLQHLQFPLLKGKSWTTDYTFRPRRRDVDRNVRAVTKVTDFTEVSISAGFFNAFKLEREAQFRSVDHWVFVYYWSLQTKSVVKYRMEVLKDDAAGDKREIELIKFGAAR